MDQQPVFNPEEQGTSQYSLTHLVSAFVIGLIIGVGGYYVVDNRSSALGGNNDDSMMEENSDNTANEDEGVSTTDNGGDPVSGDVPEVGLLSRIVVNDQPAGLRVMLEEVTVGQKAWIAVYEDQNGNPDSILGAARFDKGTHMNVDVKLLRNTVENGTYYVIMHSDDGDDVFDHNADGVVVKGGTPAIQESFKATRIR